MKKVILLVVIIVFVLTGCGSKQKISKEEYDRIDEGQDYNTVMDIIGFDGKMLTESGNKGTDDYSCMYKWDGQGPMGANAVVSFVGNKVYAKTQYQLKGSYKSNDNYTIGIKYQDFCKSFLKNWISNAQCTSHKISFENPDVKFPGKHTVYAKELWSNDDEQITIDATVENDKTEGEIYSVEITLHSQKNSEEALKLYNLCKYNAVYSFIDSKLAGQAQNDKENAAKLLENKSSWGAVDIKTSQDGEHMKFHLSHFKN